MACAATSGLLTGIRVRRVRIERQLVGRANYHRRPTPVIRMAELIIEKQPLEGNPSNLSY